MMEKADVDPIIIGFVGSITYIALLAFVIIAALGQLGIQTTSFIAILGAAGLAIGLALQGSLANFAAGFLMIIFRPFKVGDFHRRRRGCRCCRSHSDLYDNTENRR